jgi:hypothetical protein
MVSGLKILGSHTAVIEVLPERRCISRKKLAIFVIALSGLNYKV